MSVITPATVTPLTTESPSGTSLHPDLIPNRRRVDAPSPHQSMRLLAVVVSAVGLLGACSSSSTARATRTKTVAIAPVPTSAAPSAAELGVTISGGYDTDPQDDGRPIVLVASLLGVSPAAFRQAFSGVTPAKGAAPQDAQVHLNKDALLAVLGPLGVTNDALDAASNSYRYLASAGEVWSRAAATVQAVESAGMVTGFTIVDGGRGYTSAPTITVTGPDGSVVTATGSVSFTGQFATNGSLTSVALDG